MVEVCSYADKAKGVYALGGTISPGINLGVDEKNSHFTELNLKGLSLVNHVLYNSIKEECEAFINVVAHSINGEEFYEILWGIL
jgi:hypothetical protein